MQFAGNTPVNPHQMWQFAVELDGFETAFFTEVSGNKFTNEVSEFGSGGSLYNQKSPGRMTFDDLVFKKGVSQTGTDNAIMAWQAQIASVQQGTGTLNPFKTLDVVEYDRTGTEIRRYRFHSAFIKSADMGQYKYGSSDATIQELTVAYNWSELVS